MLKIKRVFQTKIKEGVQLFFLVEGFYFISIRMGRSRYPMKTLASLSWKLVLQVSYQSLESYEIITKFSTKKERVVVGETSLAFIMLAFNSFGKLHSLVT